MRVNPRKDNNHAIIVDAIRKAGGDVLDTSALGHGIPDLIVMTKVGIQLAEIKNPQTQYGKRLSKYQVKWATEWKGPIYILRTIEDAIAFVLGKFDSVEKFSIN